MKAAKTATIRATLLAIAFPVLVASFSGVSWAGETEWRDLQARTEQAILDGGYSAALGLAFTALDAAKQGGGAIEHRTAAAEDLLGYVLFLTGDYDTAESYLRAALERREVVLGPWHPAVAQTLERLSLMFQKAGRYDEAFELALRAVDIREKATGAEAPDTAFAYSVLASALAWRGVYAESYPLHQQALAVFARDGAPTPLDAAIARNSYAILLYIIGRFDEAIDTAGQALTIIGGDHPEAGESLNIIAASEAAVGRYADAEAHYNEAARLRENTLGHRHPDLATTLNNLAVLLQQLGRYGESEELMLRALEIREARLGANHPFVGTTLANLVALLKTQGRFDEAVPLARRGLAIAVAALGPDHPEVAVHLVNLGGMLEALGEYGGAEQLLRRALTLRERALGPDHPETATVLDGLGGVMRILGRPAEAEALQVRALAIWETALGPDHPHVATARNNLASLLLELGQADRAEKLFRAALAVWEQTLGPEHPDVAAGLNNLAKLLWDQGRLDEAEALLIRALSIAARYDRPENRLQLAANFALFLEDRGKDREALAFYQQAVDTLDVVYANTRTLREGTRGAFINKYRYLYQGFMDLLLRLHLREPDAGYDRRLLEVASRNQSRIFTELMIQADVNQFLGDPAFQTAMLTEQDAAERLIGVRMVRARLAATDSDFEAKRAALEAQVAVAEAAYGEARQSFDTSYPRYLDLFAPRPVTVEQAQGLLGEREAILVYTLLEERGVLFVITPTRFELVELPVKRKTLSNLVRHVHRASQGNRGLAGLAALNPKQLNGLYEHLLGPAEPLITGIESVIIIADGPLYTLPFELLVRTYGASEKAEFKRIRRESGTQGAPLLSEYATLDFAARHYRFVYVPSLTALRALRENTDTPRFDRSLVAFADPVFQAAGSSGADGAAGGIDEKAASFLRLMTRSAGGGQSDVFRLERLENTAREATAIAEILGGDNVVYLREQASERVLKQTDLSSTRYLLFATHGFLGGDFQVPGAQPSLALSLVDLSEGEDGFLTMGEVLNLNLNAELVALSACKTAGEIKAARNGEGFAGLTRAFMYAGAQNVLVTHWRVETHASEMIMQQTFRELARGVEPAEALRRSQGALRDGTIDLDGTLVSGAHPFFWAPFVMVGTGRR